MVAREVHGRADILGQGGEVEAGRLLLPRELAPADRPGEAGVPDRPVGEHHEMAAVEQGELGAEDRGQAHGLGRHREADDPVEAVVVGDREPGQAEPGGLVDQLLGVAGTVEEGEVGVAVQLRVPHRTHDSIERVFGQSRGLLASESSRS